VIKDLNLAIDVPRLYYF